jgi:hypothetical protein
MGECGERIRGLGERRAVAGSGCLVRPGPGFVNGGGAGG